MPASAPREPRTQSPRHLAHTGAGSWPGARPLMAEWLPPRSLPCGHKDPAHVTRRADSLWGAAVKSKTRSVPPRCIANDPSAEAGLCARRLAARFLMPLGRKPRASRGLRPVALGTFPFSEHCEAEGWGGFLSQSCLESSERLGSWVKFFPLEIRNLNLRVKRLFEAGKLVGV